MIYRKGNEYFEDVSVAAELAQSHDLLDLIHRAHYLADLYGNEAPFKMHIRQARVTISRTPQQFFEQEQTNGKPV